MVSCLAKRVKYQLLQGETILDHCMLRYVTYEHLLHRHCLLVQQQNMAETLF